MKLRSFKKHDNGNVQLILMAVVAGIVIAISIAIIFSILGGIDYTTLDSSFVGNNGTFAGHATNASNNLQTNVETFYTISPIYLIVLAAVGIISAIMMIMVKKR